MKPAPRRLIVLALVSGRTPSEILRYVERRLEGHPRRGGYRCLGPRPPDHSWRGPEGAIARGKAIWIIRRGEVRIDDIEFIGAEAVDRNGAGIRLEGAQLTVRRCLAYGNETGILTGAGDQTTLVVEDSAFADNGFGDGQFHHLYAGGLASLTVTGSDFHHGNVGHNIKSRAARNGIPYNRLADERGGQASYELAFSNGGVADVIGNIVQQSASTQNSVMVPYGTEGLTWPHNALRLIHNTLINDHPGGATFVRVRGVGVEVVTRNNLHAGKGRWIVASEATNSAGDAEIDWQELVRPTLEDCRLNERGRRRFEGASLAATDPAMTPEMEYTHPSRRSRLTGPPRLPGALQSAGP